jgi:DNA-directed RNA polymerase
MAPEYAANRPKKLKRPYIHLAEIIEEAIRAVLPGAVRSRTYLRSLATSVLSRGQFVSWRSPSGFPIIQANYEPNVKRLRVTGGHKMNVTIGDKLTIDTEGAIIGVAANFVHSLDAAHMLRCVLSAKRAGITNVLTIHDCLGVLAADAADIHRIFRRDLYVMYKSTNWLDYLRQNNGYDTPPEMGDYKVEQLPKSNYGLL